MNNQAMQRKLADGEAIDISGCEQTPDGLYVLKDFREGVDYCDAVTERWIWSIGRRRSDSVLHASLSGDLYLNPEYECVWLR